MSKLIFDFLSDSLLLDTTLINENYRSISNEKLLFEIRAYREYCIKNLGDLTLEINNSTNILSCLGSGGMSELSSLKRSALYVEQMVLPDPIFPFSESDDEFKDALFQYAGLPTRGVINKIKLANAASKLLSTRSMVAAGYIKYYPVSYHSEILQIPLGYSEVGFSDVLPSNILDIYRSKAIANSIEKSESGLIIRNDLEICRDIFVRFLGSEGRQGFGYNLMAQKTVSFDEKTRMAEFSMYVPDTPPSKAEFDEWVSESINRSAIHHYQELVKEISLSNKLGSVYSSMSKFNGQLLRSSLFEARKGIAENAIECVLKMELPYMDLISPEDLMSIRQNDGEEFQNFRTHIEDKFKELRHEANPEIVKTKIEDIEHELSEVQLRAISAKIKSVRKVALADVGVAVAGLAAGIATSGMSLLGTLAALMQGAKTYSEYQEKVKENPCYFLWSVKNKQKGVSKKKQKNKAKSKATSHGKIVNLKVTGTVLR